MNCHLRCIDGVLTEQCIETPDQKSKLREKIQAFLVDDYPFYHALHCTLGVCNKTPNFPKTIAHCKVRIWSGEQNKWWKAAGCGYTENKSMAGVYDFEKAYELTNHYGPENKIEYFEISQDEYKSIAMQDFEIKLEYDKILILTVGLPHSGKSTWAKEQGFPIVNPDSIRLAVHGQKYLESAEHLVWAIAKTMVSSLFLSGHKIVILDACNNTRKRRDEWISDDWFTCFQPFNTKISECMDRTDDAELRKVISRMGRECDPLQEDEVLWF